MKIFYDFLIYIILKRFERCELTLRDEKKKFLFEID